MCKLQVLTKCLIEENERLPLSLHGGLLLKKKNQNSNFLVSKKFEKKYGSKQGCYVYVCKIQDEKH